MKNLRRLLVVFLTVAMLATMVAVPVSAAEMEDAIKLETLGILKGSGSGVNAAYRASVPTRYQAAWLFLRLLGKEEAAKSWAGALNFTDASTAKTAAGSTLNAENKTMLAYLFAHNNLGFKGYPDGTFRPFIEINAQMYYKLMLTALGYVENTDFTWDNVFTKCVEYGLTTTAPTNSGTFNIDALATATVQALKADLKSGTKTLIEKLVNDDKCITAEKATQAGFTNTPPTPPVSTNLEVTNVSALTLGEIIVIFNKAINDKTLENGITVGGTPASCELGTVANTVIVTVPVLKRVANGNNYTIGIATTVKATDGSALAAAYSKTVTVFDSAKPFVQSVTLTGPQTFELLFSEILDTNTAGLVRVNSGAIGVISASISGRKVTVTLATPSLTEGTYPLSIAGFKDLAGFTMEETTSLSLGYAKDKTPPTVTVISASQTEIVFEFSKPVANVLTPTDYYHTYLTYTATSISLVSGNRYKAVFGNNPIPEGTYIFYIKNENIVDVWGNKMPARVEIPVTVTADRTPPYVLNIKSPNNSKIEIYFSELINQTDALTSANYTVMFGTEKLIPALIQHSIYVENNQQMSFVTLNFNSALTGGAYNISVKNIYDMAITPNRMMDYSTTILITDTTPINPALVKATLVQGAAIDYIYITYPEAMNDTAMSKGMYIIKYQDATTISLGNADTVEVFSPKIYRITRAHDANLTVNGLTKIIIGPVQDASGNAVNVFSFEVTLVGESAAAVVPNTLEQTDYNKISVQFDKTITQILPDAFVVNVGGILYKAATIDSILVNDGKTLVSFTLTSDCVTAIKTIAGANYETNTALVLGTDALAAIQVLIDGDYLTTNTGMKGTDQNLTGTMKDKRIPRLSSHSLELTGGVVKAVLVFTEHLSATNAAFYANDLIVRATATGTPLTAGLDFATTIVDGKLYIEIVGHSAQNYYFGTKTEVTYIKDNSGNKIAPFVQFQQS